MLSVSFIEDDDLVWGNQVLFRVNGAEVRDLVSSSADEDWVGPPIHVLALHPEHLLGGPDRWEDDTDPWYDDPAILACPCGQPGCRAVVVHIELADATVVWSAFRRSGSDEGLGVGPFRFDRADYELVMRTIAERGSHT